MRIKKLNSEIKELEKEIKEISEKYKGQNVEHEKTTHKDKKIMKKRGS